MKKYFISSNPNLYLNFTKSGVCGCHYLTVLLITCRKHSMAHQMTKSYTKFTETKLIIQHYGDIIQLLITISVHGVGLKGLSPCEKKVMS